MPENMTGTIEPAMCRIYSAEHRTAMLKQKETKDIVEFILYEMKMNNESSTIDLYFLPFIKNPVVLGTQLNGHELMNLITFYPDRMSLNKLSLKYMNEEAIFSLLYMLRSNGYMVALEKCLEAIWDNKYKRIQDIDFYKRLVKAFFEESNDLLSFHFIRKNHEKIFEIFATLTTEDWINFIRKSIEIRDFNSLTTCKYLIKKLASSPEYSSQARRTIFTFYLDNLILNEIEVCANLYTHIPLDLAVSILPRLSVENRLEICLAVPGVYTQELFSKLELVGKPNILFELAESFTLSDENASLFILLVDQRRSLKSISTDCEMCERL